MRVVCSLALFRYSTSIGSSRKCTAPAASRRLSSFRQVPDPKLCALFVPYRSHWPTT